MNAVQLLCDGTIRAAWRILLHKGIDTQTVDAGKLAEVLRNTINSNLDNVLAEWREATDARVGEGWLREMMNAQANEMALAAIKSMGY